MTTKLPKSRHGDERILTNNGGGCYTVEGPSLFHRCITDNDNKTIGFDFEGGPCVTLGGKFRYLQTDWVINKITQEPISQENLLSVLLEVELSN